VLPPAVNRLGGYIENDNRLAAKLISANTWAGKPRWTDITNSPTPVTLLDDESIRTGVHDTVNSLENVDPDAWAGDVGGLLGDAVLAIVIGVYWLTSVNEAVEFTLQLFALGQGGAPIREIILEIEQTLGAYVRGVGVVVLFVGAANFLLTNSFACRTRRRWPS